MQSLNVFCTQEAVICKLISSTLVDETIQQSFCTHHNYPVIAHLFCVKLGLFSPLSPLFSLQVFSCNIQLRSITPDKPGPYRQKCQRNKGDLIFKTLLYIMHMDHTFLNLHSQYMAMVCVAMCSPYKTTSFCL